MIISDLDFIDNIKVECVTGGITFERAVSRAYGDNVFVGVFTSLGGSKTKKGSGFKRVRLRNWGI